MKKRVLFLASVMLVIVLFTQLAWADYAALKSVSPLGDYEICMVEAINDQNQIVGKSRVTNGEYHAFLWENGKTTDLGALVNDYRQGSYALALNNLGQVVGVSYVNDGNEHAVLWDQGKIYDLGTLGGKNSGAIAINNKGQILGWAETAAGNKHAVLWENLQIKDLGSLGGDSSYPTQINELGQVIGSTTDADGNGVYFIWEKGVMQPIKNLDGTKIYITGINNRGQCIGSLQTTEGKYHGLLWENGRTVDLGTIAGGYSSAEDINDSGQIVGNSDGHPFLWENGQMKDLLQDTTVYNNRWFDAKFINNRGQVIGLMSPDSSEPGPYSYHVFLWEEGALKDKGSIGDSTHPWIKALNNQGRVIGSTNLLPRFSNDGIWGYILDLADSPQKERLNYIKEPGDVNDDSRLDVSDVALLKQYLMNPSTEIETVNADVNDDGTINIHDYILLKKTVSESQRGIYLAGWVGTAGEATRHACYWKDGQRIDLSQSESEALGIFVQGQDIYVSGKCNNRPCYWKNGEQVDLAQIEDPFPYPNKISVSDSGDVYVKNTYAPKMRGYWKNGTYITPENDVYWSDIVLEGSDVYISGSDGLGPCYWKNGIRISLPLPQASATCYAIMGPMIVNGPNDIYVSCSYNPGAYQATSLGYWHNGQWNCIPGPATDTRSGFNIRDLSVNGKEVYLLADPYGLDMDKRSFIWRNGVKSLVPRRLTGILTRKNELYSIEVATKAGPLVPFFRKNGFKVLLPEEKGQVNGILVVEN